MPLYESVKDYNCHEEQKKHITKSQTHCNSCGAPINPHLEKCEYCGTYYLKNVQSLQPNNKKMQQFIPGCNPYADMVAKELYLMCERLNAQQNIKEDMQQKSFKNKIKKYLERRTKKED